MMDYGELIFALGVVIVTSLISCAASRKYHPAGARTMSKAVRALFDWAGVFTLFFSGNLAIGLVVIFLLRAITRRFFGLYGLENFLLLILSAAQAFVFHTWWRGD